MVGMRLEDIKLVGDFMGLGHDQVLFINTGGSGGRVLIADLGHRISSSTGKVLGTMGTESSLKWLA